MKRAEVDAANTSADSLFPESKRVVFAYAPLHQVVCQFRFPAILRLEAEPPAEFQDRVRSRFPLFQRQEQPFVQQLPVEVLKFLANQVANKVYLFQTKRQEMSVTLSQDSLSVTTNAYTRWEDFSDALLIAQRALVDVYKVEFFSRIGLRYTNIIDREKLGLAGVPWRDLLLDEIVGEMAFPAWESQIVEARTHLRVMTPSGTGAVLLQHGLVQDVPGRAPSYLLDFDFYTDAATDIGDTNAILDRFHHRAGRAFRWSIKPRLCQALEPKPTDDDK